MNKKLVNAALLTSSLLLSLLVLEVGLRFQAYKEGWTYQFANFRNREMEIASNKTNNPAVFDAELGWVPRAGVWKDKYERGPVVTIVEDGIRSNGAGEVPTGQAEAILAVGDSFTFGDQVADWETWPAQLEKLSGRRVINGGVFGYGLDQAFLRARGLLSRSQFSTVIFSFIPHDIQRCQLSERGYAGKPYFDFKDGRLTLENVPVPPPQPRPKESRLHIALGHSLLAHTVAKRFFPESWLGQPEREVHDEEQGRQLACALLHELEGLTKAHGSELIVLAQHAEKETVSQSIAVERVLSCLSDPATRVLDLKPALSELKANDPARYIRLFDWHMTPEGNQFVALEISKILTQR